MPFSLPAIMLAPQPIQQHVAGVPLYRYGAEQVQGKCRAVQKYTAHQSSVPRWDAVHYPCDYRYLGALRLSDNETVRACASEVCAPPTAVALSVCVHCVVTCVPHEKTVLRTPTPTPTPAPTGGPIPTPTTSPKDATTIPTPTHPLPQALTSLAKAQHTHTVSSLYARHLDSVLDRAEEYEGELSAGHPAWRSLCDACTVVCAGAGVGASTGAGAGANVATNTPIPTPHSLTSSQAQRVTLLLARILTGSADPQLRIAAAKTLGTVLSAPPADSSPAGSVSGNHDVWYACMTAGAAAGLVPVLVYRAGREEQALRVAVLAVLQRLFDTAGLQHVLPSETPDGASFFGKTNLEYCFKGPFPRPLPNAAS
jgi:hypothetical protein